MRKNDPSDISRKQFDKIRWQLESFRKKTKTVDLYDVWYFIRTQKRLPMAYASK